jgi:hypothetical protein
MRISHFNKPITAKSLNESLDKRFGQTVDVDKFSTDQLMDARNKLRTALHDIETNESFDAVGNEDYQKKSMFLKVINQAIDERAHIVEGDVEADKAITEGAEEEATLVMAAKDMVDRVTGWMEDTAEMQTESMLEIGDKIRDEMGSEQSESFIGTVKPALEQLFTTLETTRDALTGGVAVLTGEGAPETMGDEAPAEEDPEMEPTVDAEAEAEAPAEEGGDEFAAAEPATGGEEDAGRPARESIERSRRLGTILGGADSKKK